MGYTISNLKENVYTLRENMKLFKTPSLFNHFSGDLRNIGLFNVNYNYTDTYAYAYDPDADDYYVGGIVGQLSEGVISNAYVTGK